MFVAFGFFYYSVFKWFSIVLSHSVRRECDWLWACWCNGFSCHKPFAWSLNESVSRSLSLKLCIGLSHSFIFWNNRLLTELEVWCDVTVAWSSKWVHHQTSAVKSRTRSGITFRNTQSKHKYERQTVEVKDPTHVKPSFVKELTTWYLRLHYQRFLKTWLNFSSCPVQVHDSDDRWRSRLAHLDLIAWTTSLIFMLKSVLW